MKALIIGGTGPTGPYVVEGLLDRGYQVTIFHSGQHEAEFTRPVEHLHGDPHFQETMQETLGNRTYDLIVFMYGRLRIAAEVAKGRTGRFIAVAGSGGYARSKDPRWGPLGKSFAPNEDGVWQIDPEVDKFHYLMHISQEKVLEIYREGHYNATIIRPPNMYGPRQMAPEEWCIIRRILDGRKKMIMADGGLKIEARIYVENSARAVLLAVDKPQESAGKRYNVRDERLYTIRQRIELVGRTMGHEFDFVDMPYALAKPCHVLWRHRQEHMVVDDSRIRRELGYRDLVRAEEAIPRTVRWLLEHRPRPGGEAETQLGDPFDYAAEDELIHAWEQGRARVEDVPFNLPTPAHRYRHPKTPGEMWRRPESSSYASLLGDEERALRGQESGKRTKGHKF